MYPKLDDPDLDWKLMRLVPDSKKTLEEKLAYVAWSKWSMEKRARVAEKRRAQNEELQRKIDEKERKKAEKERKKVKTEQSNGANP